MTNRRKSEDTLKAYVNEKLTRDYARAPSRFAAGLATAKTIRARFVLLVGVLLEDASNSSYFCDERDFDDEAEELLAAFCDAYPALKNVVDSDAAEQANAASMHVAVTGQDDVVKLPA